ncbi:DUF4031 domain-containing protein [Streptomyces sp. AcH 505]|uniref:DUF4031 domain-containing protein n=1 Tax=Streptomyces sp. AcH 505 TaxID=352211 RepID=UPI0007C81642
MSVYVDEIRDYTRVARMRGLRHTHWCHLLADTENELHAFAARLGLRRSWFQAHDIRWHYDVTPNKRALALQLGAQEADRHFVAQLMDQRRAAIGRPTFGAVPNPAAAVEVRDMCFRCPTFPLVPRALMATHIAEHHPETLEN